MHTVENPANLALIHVFRLIKTKHTDTIVYFKFYTLNSFSFKYQ